MVPIGTVAQLKSKTIPYRVPRYNLFPAAEVQGVASPGVATGTALHRMEELAHEVLPKGIAFDGLLQIEWVKRDEFSPVDADFQGFSVNMTVSS